MATPKDVNGNVGNDNSKGKKKNNNKGEEKTLEKNKKKNKSPEKKAPLYFTRGGDRTIKLPGGLVIHELAEGNGEIAKKGSVASVRYTGRLKTTNKVFDSNVGPHLTPLKLVVGRKEVIDGFDEGLEGMKVGGKRKFIIPPHKAYGSKFPDKAIPPNSALIFDIELIKVLNKKK